MAETSDREMAPALERSRVLKAVRRAVRRLGGKADSELFGCCCAFASLGVEGGGTAVAMEVALLRAPGELWVGGGGSAGERFRGVACEDDGLGDGGAHCEIVEFWSLEGLGW